MIHIFDNIMAGLLSRKIPHRSDAVRIIVKAFEDECELEDSAYYEHDDIQTALRALHPQRAAAPEA